MVRKCANGDEVDATLCIVAKGVEGDAARRFGFELTSNHLNGFARGRYVEIVDHISAIRAEAKALEDDANTILEQAKKKVEEMILGEE